MIGRRIPDIELLVDSFRLDAVANFAGFAHAQRCSGKTYREIAEANGVHPSTVRRYVKWLERYVERYALEDDLEQKSNAIRLTCIVCEEQFTSLRADKRHCSNACRQDAYRKRKLGAA